MYIYTRRRPGWSGRRCCYRCCSRCMLFYDYIYIYIFIFFSQLRMKSEGLERNINELKN